MHSKGSIWYNPQYDLIGLQVTYEPMVNELELWEPRVSGAGIFRNIVYVHDFKLLGWEWIGSL